MLRPRLSRHARAALALTLLATSGVAHAQTPAAAPPAPRSTQPGQDAGPAQAPEAAPAVDADELPAICTDRPTKSSAACTVEPGHIQYEVDLFNGAFFRDRGTKTDVYLLPNPTLKLGLTKGWDVQANIAPYVRIESRDAAGARSDIDGIGDLYLRLKSNFYTSPGGRLAIAAIPYVKAPTAKLGVGNGEWEGGAVFTANYKLTDVWTLTVTHEVDVLKDAVGNGRHVQHIELINIGRSLPGGVTVYGELWGAWNYDPQGTIRQYSADFAVARAFRKHAQVDAGVNFGLNRYTPDAQVYVGLSQKF